jgi:lipid A ethanolaminephosphotransferase
MKINYLKIIIIYSLFITLIFNFHIFDYFENAYYVKFNSEFNKIYFLAVGFLLIFTILVSIFLLLGQRFLLKPLVIILVFTSAINYYFLNNLKIVIDEGVIQSTLDSFVDQNWGEINDLLTFKYFTFLFFSGFLPSIILICIKIEYPNFKREITTRIILPLFLFLVTGTLVFSNYKNISFIARGINEIKTQVIPHYFISNVKDYIDVLVDANRDFIKLKYSAVQSFPEEKMVGVFIIGETARADRFSLNGYSRKTNPFLEKQNIHNFSEAYSCGTYTAVSVPCMFTLSEYKEYNAHESKFQENLLDLIKSSDIETVWIGNNSSCKHVCDRVKTIDYVDKDSENYIGYGVYDEVVIDGLKKVLSENKSNKILIILHTMGSHGPAYFNRYPDEFEKFKPSCVSSEPQSCSADELNNSFDNTILYTDYIISKAINILKNEKDSQNFLIYASDHGESLGENGVYLHAAPMRIAPKEQIHIPVLMWASENLKKKRKLIGKNYPTYQVSKNKITHEYLPHTILDFFNLKTLYLKENKSMLSVEEN